MTTPETSTYVADIVSAADILRAYLDREDPDVSRLLFNQDVEGMAMALAEAGRLTPAGNTTRTEYAVRLTDDDGRVTVLESDRQVAEIRAALHAQRRAAGPWRIAFAEVVQRTVVTSTGPWQPVPATGEPHA